MSNCVRRILDRCATLAQGWIPAHCALCAASSPGEHLCLPCKAQLPRLPPERCSVCALPLAAGSRCGTCLINPPAYDGATAAYAYRFPVDALIGGLKYRGDLALAPPLALALTEAVAPVVDAIVPMPLAAARLAQRGFNQAQELARPIGGVLGLPVLPAACRRVVETAPQAALPWHERARNVRHAFVCDHDCSGMALAVVDDVMTTGATMNELARSLKRAGAVRVEAWVVARTLRD